MNSVNLVGRLTRDPEIRYIPSGTAVGRFNLAVDKGLSKDKKTEMESQNKPTADFINIVVWGKIADVEVDEYGFDIVLYTDYAPNYIKEEW